jgi:hypothetical protein
MYFKEFCPGVLQNSVQGTKRPGFFKVIKYGISDNANEHFDSTRREETGLGTGHLATSHEHKRIEQGEKDV